MIGKLTKIARFIESNIHIQTQRQTFKFGGFNHTLYFHIRAKYGNVTRLIIEIRGPVFNHREEI